MKEIALVLATIITIYYAVFINYKKGFNIFLIFLAFSSLIGYSRAILSPAIVLPISMILGIFLQKKELNNLNYWGFFLFLYSILITLINKTEIFDDRTLGSTFLAFFLLMISPYLFNDRNNFLRVLLLIWAICLGSLIFYLINGTDVTSVSNVQSRGIYVELRQASADPNYVGIIMGVGLLLSVMYLLNIKTIALEFNIKSYRVINYFVIAVGVLEFWLCIRGLSLGILIALSASILALLIKGKKIKIFFIVATLISIFIIFFNDVVQLYILRFDTVSTTGSGRYEVWATAWKAISKEGFFRVLFGGGASSPWWKHAMGISYFSTHNSFLTLLIDYGIIGVSMFLIIFFKSLYINFKDDSFIGKSRFVLIIFMLVVAFSLEPLAITMDALIFSVVLSYNKIPSKRKEITIYTTNKLQ